MRNKSLRAFGFDNTAGHTYIHAACFIFNQDGKRDDHGPVLYHQLDNSMQSNCTIKLYTESKPTRLRNRKKGRYANDLLLHSAKFALPIVYRYRIDLRAVGTKTVR